MIDEELVTKITNELLCWGEFGTTSGRSRGQARKAAEAVLEIIKPKKSPPIPEVIDLPPNTFSGDKKAWESLSPGFRRTIWREAMKKEKLND